MNRDRARYWVELGGAAYRIRALRGREALSRPFRFELDFHAEEGSELSQDGLVKSDATLRIDRSEGPDRTLDCIVTDVSVGVAIRGAPLVRVVLEHRLALARLRVDVRLFRDKTAPEIVEEVLAAHGVGCELRLRKGYTRRPYTVQQRESDFDFASRLLEDEGIFYACGPGGSIALGDGPKAYAEAAIALPFRPDAGLESPGDVVTAAGGFAALAPGRVTLRDWNAEKPSLDMDVRAGGAPTPTAPEFYDYPGEYGDPALGSDRAQTTAEAFQVAAGGYALKTDCARLAPGATLRILDAPPGVPEAELVVTAVAHDYDREGGGFLASLEALDATVAARPPRTTFVPTQVNPVTAFVTGPPGEDVYTDEYGRVKVHFHWDRLFPRDDTCSHWVPVLQDNTGQSSAIPRIGWEVLVHFLEGDPDRPVILGRVYNTADPFPVDLPAQKTHTSLRSLCSPGRDGFNEIKLEDKAGVEFFLVHAERDQTIIVANDKNEHVLQTEQTLVRRDQSITVGASSYITVSGSRSLDVLGNQTWSVGGNRKVVLGDAETHDVKASRALTVGGMHTRKIGDNDSVTAKTLAESVGGVILELSLKSNTTECGNALAVTVGGAIIDVSKGSNAVTAQLGRFETVGALAFTKAGGAVRVRADKTRTTTVGGLLKIDAAKDVTLTGGEEITLRATTASFSATDGPLTLKVGDTRVELKEGKITVDAKTAIKLSIHATNNQGADVSTRELAVTPGIVCFHCTAASGVTVRAYLNDLPVFKRTRQGHLTMQGGANQFMLPGENELVLEVLRAPRPRSTGAPPGEALRFAVYTADDPVNAPKDVRFLHDLHYASQILEPNLATEEEPYCYRARFPVDVPVVTPRYRSADVVEVGCRGTPELHAVVAELHDVVARADVDAFLDLHAVRMAEYARAYGSFGPASMATQIQDARTFFGAGVVEAQDLAPERLHFESRAGGRVVFVSRLDEEPAIGARAGQELLKGNLWLARFEQSRWTLVG